MRPGCGLSGPEPRTIRAAAENTFRADLVVRDPKGIHGEKSPCNSILNNKGIPPHGSPRDP
jgi:hypothetical protein